jgi:hypothetical protein
MGDGDISEVTRKLGREETVRRFKHAEEDAKNAALRNGEHSLVAGGTHSTNPSPQPIQSKPEVALPGIGRPKSQFCADMGAILGPLHILFLKDNRAVELVMEEFDRQLDARGLAHGGFKFQEMDPCKATTWVEDFIVLGRHQDKNNKK